MSWQGKDIPLLGTIGTPPSCKLFTSREHYKNPFVETKKEGAGGLLWSAHGLDMHATRRFQRQYVRTEQGHQRGCIPMGGGEGGGYSIQNGVATVKPPEEVLLAVLIFN